MTTEDPNQSELILDSIDEGDTESDRLREPEMPEDTTDPSISFKPADINIKVASPTISNLIERIKYTEIDLTPPFQRKFIWDETRQSRLIESILLRFPLPAFYFDATDPGNWLVVDGMQRLTSLRNFILGDVNKKTSDGEPEKLKLIHLEYLKELEGKTFDQLERHYQRRINEAQIVAYQIENGTPEDVKFNLFNRINTGGINLTVMEIHIALNQGKAIELLRTLSEVDEFKKVFKGYKTERFQNYVYVCRFLLFYLTLYTEYSGEMETNVSNILKKINKELSNKSDWDSVQSKIVSDFQQALKTAGELFDNHPFTKKQKGPISVCPFEVWTSQLARLTQAQREKLVEKKESLSAEYSKLSENKGFIFAMTHFTGKKEHVLSRHQQIENLLSKFLHD